MMHRRVLTRLESCYKIMKYKYQKIILALNLRRGIYRLQVQAFSHDFYQAFIGFCGAYVICLRTCIMSPSNPIALELFAPHPYLQLENSTTQL
jgi:hypothetical protein